MHRPDDLGALPSSTLKTTEMRLQQKNGVMAWRWMGGRSEWTSPSLNGLTPPLREFTWANQLEGEQEEEGAADMRIEDMHRDVIEMTIEHQFMNTDGTIIRLALLLVTRTTAIMTRTLQGLHRRHRLLTMMTDIGNLILHVEDHPLHMLHRTVDQLLHDMSHEDDLDLTHHESTTTECTEARWCHQEPNARIMIDAKDPCAYFPSHIKLLSKPCFALHFYLLPNFYLF